MNTRLCATCKGTGRSTLYPKCPFCKGIGAFEEPNVDEILKAIRGRKGLRSARPRDRRAYYVWRLARFHGGADVTMPMNVMYENDGDPWLKELDELADAVAKHVFGTTMAAAHRWGRALGYVQEDIPGLPDSAYFGGRVADEHKPAEEVEELK